MDGEQPSKPKREPWRGIQWIWPIGGICPRHGTKVGAVTGLCYECHQEQIAASRSDSREWERQKMKREKKA